MTMLPKSLTIYSDGGARGNPGPGAIGVVICAGEEVLVEIGEFVGERVTNNQAEYLGVIRGLEEAIKLRASSVVVKVDSELIQRQLTGRYKVKNALLRQLWERVNMLASRFDSVKFEHIPREENARADGLVNRVLDERGGEVFSMKYEV